MSEIAAVLLRVWYLGLIAVQALLVLYHFWPITILLFEVAISGSRPDWLCFVGFASLVNLVLVGWFWQAVTRHVIDEGGDAS